MALRYKNGILLIMLLTDNFTFVRQFNELAAEVFRDKTFYKWTDREIADFRNIDELEVLLLYSCAKQLAFNRGMAWMYGLSNRAMRALILNEYCDFNKIYKDIHIDLVDIETKPHIGHSIAVELRDWTRKFSNRWVTPK